MQQSLPFDQPAATPTEPAQTGDLEHVVIPEFVRHPRARRYVVRVRGDGSVRVTIPRWGSKREAAVFAEQQRGWIKKQIARLQSDRNVPREQFSEDERRAFRVRAQRELPDRLFCCQLLRLKRICHVGSSLATGVRPKKKRRDLKL